MSRQERARGAAGTGNPARSAVRSRLPIWVPALVTGSLSVPVALALATVDGPRWAWPGDVDSARSVLQAIATAVMSATVLTFTLTLLVVQLASQQFSPRLLREFGRDPVVKHVLAILAVAFAMALTVLSTIDAEEAVPRLAVLAVFMSGLASFAAVLVLVGHLVRELRVDTMMVGVHDETTAAIRTFYPPRGAEIRDGSHLALDDRSGRIVTSVRSGFVRRTDVERVVDVAARVDVTVRIDVRAGDHVVRRTPLATVWPHSGAVESLDDEIREAIHLGYERTMDQDVAFGFRRLEDIAIKAMSPSINDPVTAVHAVGYMSDLLVLLTERRLGSTLHCDGDGRPRVIAPDRDLWYYLELACGQLRRVAGHEPTVLGALLRMLRDLAVACETDQERALVAEAVRRIEVAADPEMRPHDRDAMDDLARRVRAAAGGDLAGAYHDRSGETRSV